MKRTTTDTFVLELPLVVDLSAERTLLGRFDSARRLCNSVLGEALKRQRLMRESKLWQKARLLKDQKERSATFRKISSEYTFTSASLSAFGTTCKNEAGWIDRLGAHETQRIAERAFAAVESYGFGKKGKPRFKGINRPLHSIEAKTNASGIRWKAGTATIEWNGLTLPAMLAPFGKDDYQLEALCCDTKYCRVIWRMLNGTRRWYVQLMQKGLPQVKHEINHGKEVGLDIGPSTIAVVAEQVSELAAFCPTVKQPWKQMRKIQRAMDRSRRATNPKCYNTDGTWKKGKRQTIFSVGYNDLREELSEAERCLAAERKRSHGQMVNEILSHGTIIKSEKLSYKSFQKCFGRSVKARAPGTFVTLLRRKAESAGGEIVDLHTWSLKMSQYDHPTETYTKKPLSQRWHVLGDGSGIVQRDVYSAFLASCVVTKEKEHRHHPSHIEVMWAAQESVLRRSGWCFNQSASGSVQTFPTVKPSERIGRHRELALGHGPDAVAETREPGDPKEFALRTPSL